MMIAGHQVDDTMFSYIARNLDADTCKLLLKAEPQLTFDKSFAILQIECRLKTQNKIPQLLPSNALTKKWRVFTHRYLIVMTVCST